MTRSLPRQDLGATLSALALALGLGAPAGSDARIWLGRFDVKFTKVEAWVRVAPEGPQCWKSHAWVEPEPSAGTAKQ